MKTTHKLLFIVALLSCRSVSAQDPTASDDDKKAMLTYMTPGEMHTMLANGNGLWTEEIEMWMSPDGPSVKSKATVSNKMIMGGRYLQGMHRGNFEGMPFEGMSTMGYDNAKKKFVSTWIDNMGTGIMYAEGEWNNKAMMMELAGKQVDPVSGNELPFREHFKIIDNDTQEIEMYVTTPNGQDYMSMRIKLKRQSQNDGVPVKPTSPQTKDPKKPAAPAKK